MELFVATIWDVVQKVGGGPTHLVGHSLGTLVCLLLAAQRPEWVKSLTLFGPIAEPSEACASAAQGSRPRGAAEMA